MKLEYGNNSLIIRRFKNDTPERINKFISQFAKYT